jgi:BASS family bile acid:Na+ symporter
VETTTLIALLNVAALVTIMLSMGLQVNIQDILASARPARPLVLGLLANYVIVPIVTLGLLSLFQANPMVSVGFFILAVCPGAPLGPPLTAIARGNVPWVIGMMVILAGLSAFLHAHATWPPERRGIAKSNNPLLCLDGMGCDGGRD